MSVYWCSSGAHSIATQSDRIYCPFMTGECTVFDDVHNTLMQAFLATLDRNRGLLFDQVGQLYQRRELRQEHWESNWCPSQVRVPGADGCVNIGGRVLLREARRKLQESRMIAIVQLCFARRSPWNRLQWSPLGRPDRTKFAQYM